MAASLVSALSEPGAPGAGARRPAIITARADLGQYRLFIRVSGRVDSGGQFAWIH